MKLGELADVVRSKNAGIHYVTVDVMFEDETRYERVKETGALSAATFAERYGVAEDEVAFFEYDPGFAFKATFPRPRPAGSPGDSDVYGAQQHAPTLDIDVPIDSEEL